MSEEVGLLLILVAPVVIWLVLELCDTNGRRAWKRWYKRTWGHKYKEK